MGRESVLAILRKRKFYRVVSLVFFIFSMVFTCLGWLVIEFHHSYLSIPSHHLIGNRSSNVNAMKEKGFPFSFLVIGDTRGSETAEALIKMAFEKGNVSFMVILGDFVRNPDIWNHRFFLAEMTREISLPCPVFLVSGNDDFDDTGEAIKQTERRVTSKVYESLYGAKNFDFVFNQCLFVICDNAYPRSRFSYLSYLRETLSKEGEGKSRIFVFMHSPPRGLAEHISGEIPDDEFFSLFTSYKAITSFFGHYHGYWRGQRKGVNLIVCGGGGGHFHPWYPRWGSFHHILKVTVWQDKVSEEIIPIYGASSIEDNFEEWVFTHLFPALAGRDWILYGIFIFFLVSDVYCIIRFIVSLK